MNYLPSCDLIVFIFLGLVYKIDAAAGKVPLQRLSACLYLFSHLCHVSPEKLKYKPDGRKPSVRRCAYSGSPKNQHWVLWANVWKGAWKIISTPVKALPRLSMESRQIPSE